jgi:CBS domain-containing protein
MNNISQNQNVCTSHPFDISDDDIYEAMKDIEGYLDITPGDFKTLYRFAYKHAIDRLTHLVKAQDVMTEKVIFVKKDTPAEEVAYKMATHGIAGVPVVENEKKVIGVISEKDFLFRMGSKNTKSFMGVVAQCLRDKGCVAISIRQQKAEEIMTSPAISVGQDTLVSEIANIFTEKNINRVPVTDQNGKLLGIVARADIMQSSCYPDIKKGDAK